MEKELYKILQEIKIGINMIENTDFNKNIEQLNLIEAKQVLLYDFYQEKYFEYRLKFKTLSILTLGLYYLKNKYDYKLRCEIYEGAIDQTEDNYFNVIMDKVCIKLKNDLFNEKLKFYTKNYDQMDNFFRCIKDLSKEEKEKYLTYKIN